MSDGAAEPVIEIRDPQIDAAEITLRVQEGVRERQLTGQYGPEPGWPGSIPLVTPVSSAERPAERPVPETLVRSLVEMSARARLSELVFVSRTPIVGAVVAAVRKAWSWMAARWIGQHLAAQQTGFNLESVRFDSELLRWQEAGGARLEQLEARVRELESRLARLEPIDRERG